MKPAVWWWLAVGVVAMGCSSGRRGTSEALPGVAGEGNAEAGAGSQAPECRADQICDCPGGLSSVTTCEAGEEACDCSVCPAQAPVAQESTFVPCGGAPFGHWRWVSTDYTASKLLLTKGGGLSMKQALCPMVVDEASVSDSFFLRLKDGGLGSVLAWLRSTGAVMESCLEPQLGVGCQLTGCEAAGCGTCICHGGQAAFDGAGIAWETRDNRLILIDSFDSRSYEYCVDGDTLQLHTTDGTDLVIELERGYAFGKPTACEERSLDQCEQGCVKGRCTGTSDDCAAADSEGNCTNQQGCSWDETMCGGTPLDCGVSDYGDVPGCLFEKSPPSCAGDPDPCEYTNPSLCDRHSGCEWRSLDCHSIAPPCEGLDVDTCEKTDGCRAVSSE